jgi:alanine racemase
VNKLRQAIGEVVGSWERKLESINRIEVSREKILKNYQKFRKRKQNLDFWPVIKANAYGGGIEQMGEILDKSDFAYWVADSYQEALRVWTKSNKQVLLIGPMMTENYRLLNFDKITLGVQKIEELAALGKLNKEVRVHLEVETGMNRQGLAFEEQKDLINVLTIYPKILVEGVYSHLADAENEDGVFNKIQEKKFSWWLDQLENDGIRPRWIHLAATEGVFKIGDKRINAVRLGMGVYRGAVRLVSKIVKVRLARKGEKVSYGGTYEMKKEGWLGVVPVGYFEGLDRKLGNQGVIKYKDKYYPIVGRICMNMCVINFADFRPNLWEEVEVIGVEGENSFETNAKKCGTIDYEMMTRLNGTIRRVVVG